MSAEVAFAFAATAHAGFQLTVTLLVYPALVEVGDDVWVAAHERHSRRIVPLVVVLYGALLLAGVALVAAGPDAVGWIAVGAAAAALAVTATLAAPTHGRLTDGDRGLRRRLVVVDRWRCLAAVLAAIAAVAAL